MLLFELFITKLLKYLHVLNIVMTNQIHYKCSYNMYMHLYFIVQIIIQCVGILILDF